MKGRSVLVWRQLLLVVVTIVLCAALISVFFTVYAQQVIIEQKAREFAENASAIGQLSAQVRRGEMAPELFELFVNDSLRRWDANVALFSADGNVVAYSRMGEEDYESDEDYAVVRTVRPYVERVLQGTEVRLLGNSFSFDGYLIIGMPLLGEDGMIAGAVFLARRVQELSDTMRSFNMALRLSSIGVLLLMLAPTYLAARLFVRPIYQMRDVALRMARGDLEARANADAKGELGELATSFNLLADRLSFTIQALRLEKQRLTLILDGLGEGIVAVDAQGEITHVNPELLRMFGKMRERPPYDRLGLIYDDALWRSFDETIAERRPTVMAMRLPHDVILRASITPLVDDNGRVEGAVGLFRDVTEAERLEQTRRDYVANVSHELRTPLSSVRGLAEALKDGMVKEEDGRQRYYGFILRETLRLTRLIEDLLELSRLQSGADAFSMAKVDMRELLCEFAERYRHTVEDVGLAFHVELPEACPPTYTNADRVEQVLVVLVDNAIKFTKEGSITLSLTTGGGMVWVGVTDTGEGIPEADLPQVFDRFYKADRAHSGEGTGLGLSIAHEVVQRLGGTMRVKSKQGVGTTFVFCVPWYDPASAVQQLVLEG